MAEVRRVVSLGLEKRSSAGLKVRQPLGTLATKSKVAVAFGKGLILDEVNVKNVVFDPTLSEDVVLDTTITPELKEEGELREVVRAIQDMRKKAGLSPHDDAVLIVDSVHEDMIAKNWTYIKNAARLTAKEKGETLNVRKS